MENIVSFLSVALLVHVTPPAVLNIFTCPLNKTRLKDAVSCILSRQRHFVISSSLSDQKPCFLLLAICS